jgi:anti-sigma B factor antagonist
MAISDALSTTGYLAASGDLSEDAPAELIAAAKALIDDGIVRLVADLSGVDFVGSSGLSALVVIRQAALAAGGTFALKNPSARVLRVLTLTGMTDIFDFEWSL